MNWFTKLGASSALLVTFLTLSHGAQAAPIYEFEIDNPPGSGNGGPIQNITTSFDADNQLFSWSATHNPKNGQSTDGFWLVVSDGPNPKNHVDEYAILYGDLSTGILTSYIYNGVNGPNSWQNPAGFIETSGAGFINVQNNSGLVSYDFTLDVSFISGLFNTSDWDGVAFDDTVGIWYHASRGSNFSYDANGLLTGYTFSGQGWYDTSNQQTTEVPAPAGIALMALGLVTLVRRRG